MVADSCRNYLLITAVGGNTPAFLAGLTPGDKIASCNGKPVWSVGDFHHQLEAIPAGTPITLGIVYDKESDATPLTWPCHVILK
jgi:S1-C subfamily serine protease